MVELLARLARFAQALRSFLARIFWGDDVDGWGAT